VDPDIYHITSGPLIFGLGTELIGKGVTFVLHNDAKLEIRDRSILDIKGPADGPVKGLVITQELGSKPLQSPQYPNVTSTITDGAKLDVLGTIYLPTLRKPPSYIYLDKL